MSDQKHVYIVGAGFSVPLGGPLFTQLLTGEMFASCAKLELPLSLRQALQALHTWRNIPRELDRSLQRAYNAEELLELIDWSCRNAESSKAKAILSATRFTVDTTTRDPVAYLQQIARQLKRVVACQCEAFLDELEDGSERWKPYLEWFDQLSANDTIITFNYDTAIEKIAALAGRQLPNSPGTFESGKPRLIKLHGSADWQLEGCKIKQVNEAYINDVDIAIGMPGNAKAKITETRLFETLWGSAQQAIEQAAFVSIVGYSMPATDNNARMMILDSIAKSRDKPKRINLVLGPDMGTIRAKRMLSILQPLVGGRKSRVTDVSMFTQDYLPRVSDYLTYDF